MKKEFQGFSTNFAHRRAIYVSTEDDDRATSYLLFQANKQLDLSIEDYKGLIYLFDTTSLLESLENYLQEQKVDVIVIDAFSDLFGNNMNDSNQVRTFLNDYSQLAQRYECLVIFLHHSRKRAELDPPSKHNLLGSQGFEAKMRLVMELRKDPIIPDLRHLCLVKGNYLAEDFKSQSFGLRFTAFQTFERTSVRSYFKDLVEKDDRGGEKTDRNKKVLQLYKAGKSQHKIAEELGISSSTVNKILKERQE